MKGEAIMQRKSACFALSLFLVLTLILSGCGQSNLPAADGASDSNVAGSSTSGSSASADNVAGTDKTTANIAVNRNITSLDGSGGGFTSTTASQHIFDGLVRINKDMEPEPSLATEWEKVDDLTWRFKLREGVAFHDGSPFNADAVAFSIKHYTDVIQYKYAAQWGLAWPPTCEIVDEYTVLIKTQSPQPAVPRLVSRLPMLPVDYSGATMEDFFSAPIGTGAYKFVKWDPGIVLELTANEDYWRCTPAIKTVNYYTVTDDNAVWPV
ncbi:MAG: ABC transporter substrate-binding protein [Oscillospiraceae bacterium]